MKRRLLSIAMVLCICVNLFTFNISVSASSDSTYLSPNMAILENILYGDRQFVIDTLIGKNFKTDFSTNPHALVNYIGDENTMMDNVLSQYQNKDDPNYSAAYKAAVDIMEKVYNGEDYIQGAADWVTSFAADLLSIFSNDAQTVMNDLTYSVSQLQYESILKEALAADYTSSNGTELSTTEIELENLKRLSDAVGCLKAFQAFAYSYGKANNYDGKSEEFRNAYDYYTQYLTSYSDSIEKALGSFSDVMNFGDTDDIVSFIALMGTVAQYDLHCAELKAFDSDIPLYAAEYFISDEDLKTMKFDKSVISGVYNALSAYMFINSIATQRDSIGDTLTRMSKTANPRLKPILVKFAGEVGEAGNAKLMGYESLMRVLRAENATVDFAKWGTKKLSEKSSIIKSFKKKALTDTALSKTISGATNVVNISSWCADKTMSFGDTCKKTYELKYLKTLIAQAIVTYEDDLEVYLNNKTDENAKIVLDDLLMIQKLRLRGETIAYKMTEGQWKSPLGKLLATGTLSQDKMLMDYLTEAYQSRVDAFVGASAMPFTTDSLTIKNGEILTINYDNAYGGLYATYQKSDGTTRGIGELKYRITNGLIVESGGTVRTLSNGVSASIPYICNKGGNVQLLGNIKLLEYYQSGGNITFAQATYSIEELHISGGTAQANLEGTINCNNLSASNTEIKNIIIKSNNKVELSNTTVSADKKCTLECKRFEGHTVTLNNINISANNVFVSGNAYVNKITTSGMLNQYDGVLNISGDVLVKGDSCFAGTVNQSLGDYNAYGDILGKKITLENLILCGKLKQTITAEITVKSFKNNSPSLVVNAPIYVKGKLYNCSYIEGAKNITLIDSGFFADDSYSNDITIMGIEGDLPSKISGTIYLNCDLIQSSDTQFDEIKILAGKLTLNNNANISGKVTLNGGDLSIDNTTSKIMKTLNLLNGDLSLNNSHLTIKNILTSAAGTNIIIAQDSKIVVNSDVVVSGTLKGEGALNTFGDIINNGKIDISRLSITANTSVTTSGNAINVNDFSISGGKKVTLNSIINISGGFPSYSNIANTNNLIYKVPTESVDTVFSSDVNINGDYVVDGKTIHAKKNLSIKNGSLILKNGAKLNVDGSLNIITGSIALSNASSLNAKNNLTTSGGNISLTSGSEVIVNRATTVSGSSSYSINIDTTSNMQLKKIAIMKSFGNVVVDGKLVFKSDASLQSTVLSGKGDIDLYGDLYMSSATINRPKNFNIKGKTPQVIMCDGVSFDNLTVSNPCRAGVTFKNTVYYYGSYEKGTSNVLGTVTKK